MLTYQKFQRPQATTKVWSRRDSAIAPDSSPAFIVCFHHPHKSGPSTFPVIIGRERSRWV